MKMKRKYIILSFTAILLLLIGMYAMRENKSPKSEIADLPLTHEYAGTNFYYRQLDSVEQNVYNKLIEKLDVYEGGEIIPDEAISVNNLSRIADAMRFNDKNNYFYSLFTFPLTSDNRLVNWYTNQSEEELETKQISKLLLEIYIGENDTRLNTWNFSEDATVTNFDEQKHLFETIPENLMSEYDTIKKETEQLLDEIVTNMPNNLLYGSDSWRWYQNCFSPKNKR